MEISNLYKIEFYVPESHLEIAKEAMFEAGAGRVGAYDSCAWQTLGKGQFRPMERSDPFLGSNGLLETVSEYKVEMVCEEKLLPSVVLLSKNLTLTKRLLTQWFNCGQLTESYCH